MGEEMREKAWGIIKDVFQLLNTYSEDPYNMGKDPKSHASISPHAILAEVYARLAPLYHLLKQDTDASQDCVVELGLCEYQRVFLRPHVLYRLVPHEGCKRCEYLADMYERIKVPTGEER